MNCEKCHKQTFVTIANENGLHVCEGCLMGDITQNFSRSEFSCKCGCGLDVISIPLVHRLQVVRDILNVPILVHSGCRCPSHNYKVGGKPQSLHLAGLAVDWSVDDLDKFMEAGRLLKNWSGGYHQYVDFFHADIGRKRRW